MASVTFKITLNQTIREDSTQLVLLRITYQRKHKYIGTGVFLREKHFNPDGTYDKQNWVRKGHEQCLLLNATLKSWLDRGEAVKSRLADLGQPFTVDEVKRRIDQTDTDSLAAHVRAYIAQLRARGKDGTAANHEYILRGFCRFLKVDPLTGDFTLQQLTPEVMDNYETYLLSRKPQHASATEASMRNTASEYLRKIHFHILSFIVKHKLPDELDPLRRRTFGTAAVNRVRLTPGELNVWMNAVLPRTTKGERTLDNARNMYLISYFLHGLRASDILAAKVSQLQSVWQMQDGSPVLQYRFYTVAEKTNKTKSVLIEREILPLLLDYANGKNPDDFLFPFMPSSAKNYTGGQLKRAVNSRTKYIDVLLKKVAKDLGIQGEVSMHSARHTFADNLYEMTGDIRLVSLSLSHSRLDTTQRYVSGTSQPVVDRTNSVYRQNNKTEIKEINRQTG
ncbi:site-specific integrase [soil metagenome]